MRGEIKRLTMSLMKKFILNNQVKMVRFNCNNSTKRPTLNN